MSEFRRNRTCSFLVYLGGILWIATLQGVCGRVTSSASEFAGEDLNALEGEMLLCSSVWVWSHDSKNQVGVFKEVISLSLMVIVSNDRVGLISEFCSGVNPRDLGKMPKTR